MLELTKLRASWVGVREIDQSMELMAVGLIADTAVQPEDARARSAAMKRECTLIEALGDAPFGEGSNASWLRLFQYQPLTRLGIRSKGRSSNQPAASGAS